MADVFVLNPPVVKDFCRSARWAAKSRGRVQRQPDWLLTAVAVMEQAGIDVAFLDGAAMNLGREQVASALKRSTGGRADRADRRQVPLQGPVRAQLRASGALPPPPRANPCHSVRLEGLAIPGERSSGVYNPLRFGS